LNLYAYCNNDPVNYADPSGHEAKWWQWALFGIGVALVAVAARLARAIRTQSKWIGNIISEDLIGSTFGGFVDIGYGYLIDNYDWCF
jgi:hypothetical protein